MTLSTNELIHTIYKRLDYTADLKTRMEIVNKINDDFGDDIAGYFSYYKRSNLNIYSNKTYFDKLCNMLDKLSEYILFSPVPEEVAETLKYSKSDIPYSQESNLRSMQAGNEISFESYVRAMEGIDERDYKKYDEQNHATYTLEHFAGKMKECPYIHAYIRYNAFARNLIQDLDRQIEKLVEKGETPKSDTVLEYRRPNGKVQYYTIQQLTALKRGIGYTKNNSKEIDQEIITILREFFRPIYFQSVDKPQEFRRHLDIDFMDKEFVLGLIKVCSLTGWNNTFDYAVAKLDKLVAKANLSDSQMSVYNIFRRGKEVEVDFDNFENKAIGVVDCGRELGISHATVVETLDRIANKVVDTYEVEFEDYYYTYLVKGTYKTCTKCGKVKIASERYFGVKNDNKDGLSSVCKDCRNG